MIQPSSRQGGGCKSEIASHFQVAFVEVRLVGQLRHVSPRGLRNYVVLNTAPQISAPRRTRFLIIAAVRWKRRARIGRTSSCIHAPIRFLIFRNASDPAPRIVTNSLIGAFCVKMTGKRSKRNLRVSFRGSRSIAAGNSAVKSAAIRKPRRFRQLALPQEIGKPKL